MVSTTLALAKEDSGKTIRLAVGDTVQITLPELDPLAAWKVDVDTSVLAYAEQADQDSYWLLGEDLATFVRIFQARAEGETPLVMTCQKIGENRVQVLDTFRIFVIVGNPPRRKPAPPAETVTEVESKPARGTSEQVMVLFEVLALALFAFLLAYRLAVVAMDTARISDLMFGLLGIIGSAVVTVYVAWKLVDILVRRVK